MTIKELIKVLQNFSDETKGNENIEISLKDWEGDIDYNIMSIYYDEYKNKLIIDF